MCNLKNKVRRILFESNSGAGNVEEVQSNGNDDEVPPVSNGDGVPPIDNEGRLEQDVQ